MPGKNLSRRDFLKLASLSVFSLAARPAESTSAGQHSPSASLLGPQPPRELDVLSAQQKARLLAASRRYIAPDEEQANQVALQIDFIEGANEHASTMCGPLSISILRSAELLGAWVQPRDFWLLNPREDLLTAANAFPQESYHWYQFESPFSQFDFSSFPLLAGDLLYLHAGPADTFEHILVVNHVDESGRAFSVSNFFTETGTVIEERMLYDPRSPGEGQVYRWADRRYRNTIGITGSGGFRIWRVRDGSSLEFPADPASRELRKSLDKVFLTGGGEWFAAVKEIGGSNHYQFAPYERFHPASTIKVPLAMAFYAWLDGQPITDIVSHRSTKGTAGRTFAQLLEAMIVESEEEATEALITFLGPENIEETWRNWGLLSTSVDPRRSTATEILRFLEGLYGNRWLSAESRAHLLALMNSYTPNDATRIGTIRDQLPSGTQIYNKRGSLVDYPRVVADSGIIDLPKIGGKPQRSFAFSFHGLGKDGSSYEALESKLAKAILAFGKFLTSI